MKVVKLREQKNTRESGKKKSRKLRVLLIALGVIVVASIVGFFWYVSIYYKADELAYSRYQQGQESGEIVVEGNLTTFLPDNGNGLGIIFYPGAKVEALSYTPLLDQLRERGFVVVLVEMPFHMAIFRMNAAEDVWKLIERNQIEALGEVESWYMMGHSMGGAMASSYASSHQEKIDGLLLIGAYVYGEYPTKQALTIYGTWNANLEEYIDYTDNIIIIEGGNHAQFGNYGKQAGDPDATITDEEQQAITVEAIVEFIER
ncbi:MAG: alpha/beta fold hydrolase [Eubacteriales bacterium]